MNRLVTQLPSGFFMSGVILESASMSIKNSQAWLILSNAIEESYSLFMLGRVDWQ
ncbi:hypothetical protein P8629_10510 [Hydrogenovibrio sp. 3SP14C1]|uniref:hypothetical protein n=1 Tax=Hydrogenovibrio sp. 3SP14C1 TaxID=3038774 RepID=UPI002416EA26|nr:hypothetical protein [Hydrogenovibrio sp. 3SP14C1]MDG4813441.1 hypothetical protein [Hydrogenovibrio sp. 3SP14C1]